MNIKDKSIQNTHDCFGCGVCSSVCSHKAIEIILNRKGFYEPKLSADKCVNCGLCKDVCAYNHPQTSHEKVKIKAWASWSNDSLVRQKCSSGGVGFEIGKQLIEKGYKVIGCRYDVESQRAEHYIATTVEELIASIGSKYIQSYTEEAFRGVKRKEKYLVTGTPCQIASFRRMIRKFKCEDNFVLMDFYCHCVPSMFAWQNYLKMVESVVGKVTYASWRNKFEYGWHDSWLMGVDGVKSSSPVDWHDSYNLLIREKKTFLQSRKSQGDWFYKMFLGHYCHGTHCEEACKYKYDQSEADIRIGDLWGSTYSKDEKGVSALVSFTEKGQQVISELTNITLIEHPLSVVGEGQMKSNVQRSPFMPMVMFLLTHRIYLSEMQWKWCFKLFEKPFRAYDKFKRILKL